MKDYHSAHAVKYEPVSPSYSFTSMEVCEFLKGKKWDEVALAFVGALDPEYIRVTRGECTCDARSGRVTVFVDKEDIITSIEMEVIVHLPNGVQNGHALNLALKYGIDSPQVRAELHDEKRKTMDSGFFYAPFIPVEKK